MAIDEASVSKTERQWALAMIGVAAVMLIAILVASLAFHINPPGSVETIDPATLHLSGEFAESNLGTRIEEKGGVTTRIITAQFAFEPSCVVVPQNTPVTIKLASPDVIHGIMVVGTNVNTMVVPGYISRVRTVFRETGDKLMPCHEFCGLGHSQMLARVKVVPFEKFKADAEGRVSCDQFE